MKIRILLIFLLSACGYDYTPKPRAFLSIDLPAKEYKDIQVECDFIFEIPLYSFLQETEKLCFYNLIFPDQNSILHITYFPLRNNLLEHSEESRRLAYQHNMVADAISEQVFINKQEKVYGILYDYDGTTATAVQFYLTDSTTHFFRGALYFNTEVSDSLTPVNNFLKQDIRNIIQTFRWR